MFSDGSDAPDAVLPSAVHWPTNTSRRRCSGPSVGFTSIAWTCGPSEAEEVAIFAPLLRRKVAAIVPRRRCRIRALAIDNGQDSQEVMDEWCTGAGRDTEGRVHPDGGRQARQVDD